MRVEFEPPKIKLRMDNRTEYEAFAAAMFEDWLECELSDFEVNTKTTALVAIQRHLADNSLKVPFTISANVNDSDYLRTILDKYSQSTLDAAAGLITSGSEMFESCRQRLEFGNTAAAMGKILHDEIAAAVFHYNLYKNDELYPFDE